MGLLLCTPSIVVYLSTNLFVDSASELFSLYFEQYAGIFASIEMNFIGRQSRYRRHLKMFRTDSLTELYNIWHDIIPPIETHTKALIYEDQFAVSGFLHKTNKVRPNITRKP